MTDKKLTDSEIVKALECCADEGLRCDECPCQSFKYSECYELITRKALDLINRQKAEIERLREERDRTVKDFTEFARTAYDIPFACKYCAHSIEDGRACLWKAEHKDEEACLGRHFEYKGMVGEG